MNKLRNLSDITLSKNVNQTVHLPKVSLPIGALLGHRTEFLILKADRHQFCLGFLDFKCNDWREKSKNASGYSQTYKVNLLRY